MGKTIFLYHKQIFCVFVATLTRRTCNKISFPIRFYPSAFLAVDFIYYFPLHGNFSIYKLY